MGVVAFDPFRELFDIAGKPVVFVWRIYPGRTAGQLFQDVQKKMVENMVHPFHFKGRVIFMSMYNDIDSSQRHNEDFCRKSPSRVSACAKSFPTVCLAYLDRGYEEKLKRNRLVQTRMKVEQHCQNCDERICIEWTHCLSLPNPIVQRVLVPCDASPDTAEALLKSLIALNQLSITESLRNGAVVETRQRDLSRMRTDVAMHQS